MDTRDYHKNYLGEDQQVKTTNLILVKTSDGTEVTLTAEDLEALLALLGS
jgi:hypothetical protein